MSIRKARLEISARPDALVREDVGSVVGSVRGRRVSMCDVVMACENSDEILVKEVKDRTSAFASSKV